MISVDLRRMDSEELLMDDEENQKNSQFSWNVTSYERTSMEIQLDFEDPIQISSGEFDLVRVTFDDTRLMYDYTGQSIE